MVVHGGNKGCWGSLCSPLPPQREIKAKRILLGTKLCCGPRNKLIQVNCFLHLSMWPFLVFVFRLVAGASSLYPEAFPELFSSISSCQIILFVGEPRLGPPTLPSYSCAQLCFLFCEIPHVVPNNSFFLFFFKSNFS